MKRVPSLIIIASIVSLSLMLGACGQKGGLTRPEQVPTANFQR